MLPNGDAAQVATEIIVSEIGIPPSHDDGFYDFLLDTGSLMFVWRAGSAITLAQDMSGDC